MLASPGVGLRREGDSSVAQVSSLGFFIADGVPVFFFSKFKTQHISSHQQRLFVSASGLGWRAGGNHARKKEKRRTGYSTR
jgi:hypothetical protein